MQSTAIKDLGFTIIEFLKSRQVPGWERVHVDAYEGTAWLRGEMPNDHSRELCIECSRHVPGVRYVVNELHVVGD